MAAYKGQPAPKPSQLKSPVPSTAAIPEGSALGSYQPPTEIPRGSALETYQPVGTPSTETVAGVGEKVQSVEQPGMLMQGLDMVGRVADYPGGFVRAGLAGAAGLATGQADVVSGEDLAAAAVGKGPTAAEYLKRLGVSEGGSLDLPGIGRVSVRGAEGLALDILTDPLTLITKAIKSAPYLQQLVNAPGKASEALGEAIYKSALKAKDPKAAKAAGEILIESGAPVGGAEKLAMKIQDAATTMGKLRQGLYDRFTELGGKIDVTEGTFANANGVLKGMRQNPTLRGAADELEEMIFQYKGEGFVPIDVMSAWKTQLYDSLPKSAFNGPKLSNPAKMFKAALAKDMKTAIINAGNKVEKGLGDSIDTINSKWGTLLDVSPDMQKAVNPRGSLGLMIDGAVLASTGPKGYVVKKAYDVASSPYAKTLAGKALMSAGRSDLVNQATRQGLAATTRPSPLQPPEEP